MPGLHAIESGSRARYEMKPINDPIWQPRLQVLWIVLAALYTTVAKSHPTRALSSMLTVLAGTLLVALFGHVLMETNQKKMRPVLLVAFGATVFVLPISFQDFRDPLASAFAVAFALMMSSLLVFAFEDRISRQLRYAYFVAMIMALIAGAVGFPITLLEKATLDMLDGRKNYYVAGIQGVAAVACFGVGLAVGSWALPSALSQNRPRRSPLLISTCMGAFFPTLLFVGLYRARMVSVLGSPSNAIVFTAVHSIGLGAIPTLFLWRRSLTNSSGLRGSSYWVFGLALGLGCAVVSTAVMELLSSIPTLRSGLIRLSVVEAPTYFTVYGSVLAGLSIAVHVARSAARGKSTIVSSRKRSTTRVHL